MQTDTRTEIRFRHIIIYLIETLEYALYLLPVESDTTIRDRYFKILLQRIATGSIAPGRKRNRNFTLLRCILEGIGEDIHQYLVEVIHIHPYLQLRHSVLEAEMYLLLPRHIIEGKHHIINETNHIRFTELHEHLSLIQFTDVHQLIYQTKNTLCIPVNHQISLLYFPSLLFGQQLLQGINDQRHRSTYFMRDVDKEL